MAGSHGLMSKCVLYEPAVRVPLIVRPPGGCAPRVVDSLIEQLDVPATVREIAGAPEVAGSEGQSLLGVVGGGAAAGAGRRRERELGLRRLRDRAAQARRSTRTPCAPCQLFDLAEDPAEDHDLAARSAGGGRRRGDHGDARAAVLPHAAGAAAPEPLHGRAGQLIGRRLADVPRPLEVGAWLSQRASPAGWSRKPR